MQNILFPTCLPFFGHTNSPEQDSTVSRSCFLVYDTATTDIYTLSLHDALGDLYRGLGLPDLTPVAVFGPPAACVRGLREVAEAGAELILLNPLFDEGRQMERLAAKVAPQLS